MDNNQKRDEWCHQFPHAYNRMHTLEAALRNDGPVVFAAVCRKLKLDTVTVSTLLACRAYE